MKQLVQVQSLVLRNATLSLCTSPVDFGFTRTISRERPRSGTIESIRSNSTSAAALRGSRSSLHLIHNQKPRIARLSETMDSYFAFFGVDSLRMCFLTYRKNPSMSLQSYMDIRYGFIQIYKKECQFSSHGSCTLVAHI